MNISKEAFKKINEIEDILCGTVLVHMYDKTILNKKRATQGNGVYFEDEDAPTVTKAKVVKICSQLPENIKIALEQKYVMANIYSGKDYWRNETTGELLVLMNLEGILSILKNHKKVKKA